jgi:hypothetical protein
VQEWVQGSIVDAIETSKLVYSAVRYDDVRWVICKVMSIRLQVYSISSIFTSAFAQSFLFLLPYMFEAPFTTVSTQQHDSLDNYSDTGSFQALDKTERRY